jgi:hypothetical protein
MTTVFDLTGGVPKKQALFEVPSKTRKTVVTADGKLAKRGTRERKAAGPSKQQLASVDGLEVWRKNFNTNEANRRRAAQRKNIRFVPRVFSQWLSDQKNSGKYIGGKAEFADEIGDDEDDEEDDVEFKDSDDSSGEPSGDEEEDEIDDGAEDIAVKFSLLESKLEKTFEQYADLLDGVTADKKLARAYLATANVQKQCEEELTPEVLDLFEVKLTLLTSVLTAYLEAHPDKAIAEPEEDASSSSSSAAAGKRSIDLVDVEDLVVVVPEVKKKAKPAVVAIDLGAEDVVYEGWNPTVSSDSSRQFVCAMVGTLKEFIDIRERIPGFDSEKKDIEKQLDQAADALARFADYRGGPARFNAEAMNKFTSDYAPLIAERIKAVTEFNLQEVDEEGDIIMNDADEELPQKDNAVITAFFPPRAAVEEAKKPVAEEAKKTPVAQKAAVVEEAKKAPVAAGKAPAAAPVAAKKAPLPPVAAKKVAAPAPVAEDEEDEEEDPVMDMDAENDNDRVHNAQDFSSDTGGSFDSDAEGEGSAHDAARDKGVVAKPALEEIIEPGAGGDANGKKRERPAVTGSLDIDVAPPASPTKKPAVSAAALPFAAIFNDAIYKACATEAELRELCNAEIISEGGSDPDSLYDVKQLPADWAQTMTALKKKPTLTALAGVVAAQMWKQK